MIINTKPFFLDKYFICKVCSQMKLARNLPYFVDLYKTNIHYNFLWMIFVERP